MKGLSLNAVRAKQVVLTASIQIIKGIFKLNIRGITEDNNCDVTTKAVC
jgi:hypothetical protein